MARLLLPLILIGAAPLPGDPRPAEIRLQIREGRPFVDGVYVNGHGPYRFLVDTGTNMNLIEEGLARKLGMAATFTDEVLSALGKVSMPGSDGNVIKLGAARAERQRFQFSRLDSLHSVWPDVHGVLGQWFLSRFDYTMDLQGKRLEFGKREPDGGRSLFRMTNGRTTVTTSLGDLVLDSGAANLILFGLNPGLGDQSDMLTLTGSQTVRTVARKLVIDGRSIWRGDAVAIPNQEEEGVSGLMPLNLFKSIYVCNSENYVVFE